MSLPPLQPFNSVVANPPSFLCLATSEEFHRFSSLPTEIRLKVWRCALPPPQIIAATADQQPKFPSLPRFPCSVLILMHVNREARGEILKEFLLVRFPAVLRTPGGPGICLLPSDRDCWPTHQSAPRLCDFDRRWTSRGFYVVNARSDVVFFSKLAMIVLVAVYGGDLVPALLLTLKDVRYLAIEMLSWGDYKSQWIEVLPQLNMLKEVVLVRETAEARYSPLARSASYRFLNWGAEVRRPCSFSEELARASILIDFEKGREEWPEWNVPRIEFMAIEKTAVTTNVEVEICACSRARGYSKGFWRR